MVRTGKPHRTPQVASRYQNGCTCSLRASGPCQLGPHSRIVAASTETSSLSRRVRVVDLGRPRCRRCFVGCSTFLGWPSSGPALGGGSGAGAVCVYGGSGFLVHPLRLRRFGRRLADPTRPRGRIVHGPSSRLSRPRLALDGHSGYIWVLSRVERRSPSSRQTLPDVKLPLPTKQETQGNSVGTSRRCGSGMNGLPCVQYNVC